MTDSSKGKFHIFLRPAALAAAGRLPIFVFLFLVSLIAGATASAQTRGASASTVGPALQYTVADFDGDRRPDLVGVQTGQTDFSGTQYWIELQLSAAGRQSIPIFAQAGGIEIAARDVNGDQSLDLVLTTAWLNQPVAILINDGHGSFTRAEPAAFPNAFHEGKTNWRARDDLGKDSVAVPPSSGGETFLVALKSPLASSPSGSITRSNGNFLLDRFLTSQSGRAPPSWFFVL
jgi:hypothetical protein